MSKSGDGVILKAYEWLHARLPRYVDCRPIHVQELIESAGFEVRQAEIRKILGVPVEIVVVGKDSCWNGVKVVHGRQVGIMEVSNMDGKSLRNILTDTIINRDAEVDIQSIKTFLV